MHSKPQKRTAERLICKESWKSCLPAKTKARARMQPPFLQPSCALRSRFEAVLNRSEKVQLRARNQRQGRCRHRCLRVEDWEELVLVKTSKPRSSRYFENLDLIGDAAEGALLRSRGDAV